MANPGWSRTESPFHAGELAIQARLGTQAQIDKQGRGMIREYLSGTAEVIWEGDEISAYAGAERLLRFHLTRGYCVEGSLPLCWSAPAFSPFLENTGSW